MNAILIAGIIVGIWSMACIIAILIHITAKKVKMMLDLKKIEKKEKKSKKV